MIQTIQLTPGVVLRHYPDKRFKTAVLSVQLLRPMCREEAALNALLSAVLLRGSKNYPDMRAITMRQDELYGASLPPLLRRIGDLQTVGLFCCKAFQQQTTVVRRPVQVGSDHPFFAHNKILHAELPQNSH